jgi:hypothetical protein
VSAGGVDNFGTAPAVHFLRLPPEQHMLVYKVIVRQMFRLRVYLS